MFQFSGFAPRLAAWWCNFITPGCPIRTSADRFVFADPRSFSQLITSFFASESLGIPHTLLFTSINTLRTYLCARVDLIYHYISQLLLLLLFHSSCQWTPLYNLSPKEMKLTMAHLQFRSRGWQRDNESIGQWSIVHSFLAIIFFNLFNL